MVPDDQVTRSSGDRNRSQCIENCSGPWISHRRKFREPTCQTVVKAGPAADRTLFGGGVGEIEDALDTERPRLRKADVPMQMRSGESPAGAFGWIEAALVDGRPEVGASPELGERDTDAR